MINHELIEALIISDIAGDITDEEKSCLEKLLAESEEAGMYAKEVYQVLKSDEAIASMNAAPGGKPVKKRTSKYKLVLATVVGVMICLSPLFRNSKDNDLSAGKNNIRLVLSEGRTLKLDSMRIVTEVTDVIYNITPDTLTYQSKRMHNNDSVTLIVPEGKHQYVRLSDGSGISVNPGTTVRFTVDFNGATREIAVDGEAYITAAANREKPFIVHINHTSVQVLGTEFNVNSHDGRELISLVKGKVNIVAGDKNFILTPGQQLLRGTDGILSQSDFDITETLRRQEGYFVYAHKTRHELAKLIQRCYGIKVQVNGDQKMDLTGVIDRNESVKTFLDRHRMNYTFLSDSTTVVIN